MRTLFLIRHAKSSWDNPAARFQPPPQRAWSAGGSANGSITCKQGRSARFIGQAVRPNALTTALFFAEKFGIADEQVLREQDIYEAAPTDILQIISNLPDSAAVVCLFGHNPTFTDVANRFSDDFIDNVPTCGIVQIESEAESENHV